MFLVANFKSQHIADAVVSATEAFKIFCQGLMLNLVAKSSVQTDVTKRFGLLLK